MKIKVKNVTILVVALLALSGGCDESSISGSDVDTDADTDSDSDTDTDTDSDLDTDTDTDTDTDSDSDTDTDSDADADTGTDSVTDADTDSETDDQFPDPPENVADWVEESWYAQLDDNIINSMVWLLDKIIMGEGEINLCVRWGATSPPSDYVKNNIVTKVELWFNDWFTLLDGYGYFPYPEGVTVNLTGWAVRPGYESWVDDLGDSVHIYTETDSSGEPMCSEACGTFFNWDYNIPDCPGGDQARHDYWIWLDDTLPGAAAVGGDWGLRMPLSGFEDAMNNGGGNMVIEHEMGHGFGFQDYYEWTGSTPEGGSLMIVGSTSQQTPTVGDTWLLRRCWKEQKAIRGW